LIVSEYVVILSKFMDMFKLTPHVHVFCCLG